MYDTSHNFGSSSRPIRSCDIVMKGGITSGVVYPMAIWELSRTYRFRNVGGTSAGAIAASLTAAAEYARGNGSDTGFSELRNLPAWLQSDNNLLQLFQPSNKTRALFKFLMSLCADPRKNWPSRVFSAIFKSIYGLPAVAIMALFVFSVYELHTHAVTLYTAITYDIVALVGSVCLLVALPLCWALRDLLRSVPCNAYGLCSGMPESDARVAPLSPWLADKIDSVAGKLGGDPLTYGDLWGADVTNRDINLEMVTTNITYGRPFTIPFETALNRFYFREQDLVRLFPQRIVDWMKSHPRPPSADSNSAARREWLAGQRLYPIPSPKDLPIVVAARMSLSFPVLLSAVPLHGIDWDLPYNVQNPKTPITHRCWFSDGGLSSNFPLQFFDAPLPSRPTFGINLRAFDATHTESSDESKNVWMPEFNHDILGDSRNGFEDKGPSLLGFAAALIDTMQNWNDTLQSQIPGFRDRIVQVFLSDKEGGLNLTMPTDTLTKLTRRGQCAAQLLIERYTAPSPAGPPQTINWENHRWVRFRTSAAMLERFLAEFVERFTAESGQGEPSYAALVSRSLDGSAPFSYPWKDTAQQAYAVSSTTGMVELLTRLDPQPSSSLGNGSPAPAPELQARPRI